MSEKRTNIKQKTFKTFLNAVHNFFVVLLIIFYTLILVMPGQKVLAFSENSGKDLQDNLNLQTSSLIVKVISSPEQSVSSSVKVSTGVMEFNSCNTIMSNLNNNLVQQPLLVNLNSPANCFNLHINKVILSQKELSVKPLYANSNSIKIVVRSQSLNAPHFSSTPEVPVSPVLPTLVVWLVLAYYLFKKSLVLIKSSILGEKFINIVSLEQLQVYRC